MIFLGSSLSGYSAEKVVIEGDTIKIEGALSDTDKANERYLWEERQRRIKQQVQEQFQAEIDAASAELQYQMELQKARASAPVVIVNDND